MSFLKLDMAKANMSNKVEYVTSGLWSFNRAESWQRDNTTDLQKIYIPERDRDGGWG